VFDPLFNRYKMVAINHFTQSIVYTRKCPSSAGRLHRSLNPKEKTTRNERENQHLAKKLEINLNLARGGAP